ncbi:cytochrome b/b6 domain-containing protein [Paraburkholderia phymatum]|uniref:Cytochrome B561 n=1 Tax=Paraburkholderia phymatum (strain DSM 17167 / CIP 108236 / LMG 21445 / STM815) TaxID=391038 RepID=B2JHM9_PARP8|nr:cytochrome b/b6 domain-containing protein [Paraburkholderia phymatum]ACC70371.1 cytochrome B561 [Paraburkholderia phymatum STM815]
MNLNTFAQRPAYDGIARLLHWLIALLIAAQFVVGWTMPDVHRDTLPNGLIAWHLGVGAAIVAAVACRILWRATHTPAPAELSRPLKLISHFTHALLYALLVAVPLAGWANASSRGWAVKLLGVVRFPDLTQSGSPTGHALGDVHSVLAWALLVLIVLHVGAALFHRVVLKDGVLQRMLP